MASFTKLSRSLNKAGLLSNFKQYGLITGANFSSLTYPQTFGINLSKNKRTDSSMLVPRKPVDANSSQPWRFEIIRMAGHSKWQNIRHTKGAKDMQKSLTAMKMLQKLSVAIQEGGNTDPKYNHHLARVISEAQQKNVPKKTMDDALKRAREKKVASQKIMVCAVGPGSCFLLIECLTDRPVYTRQTLTSLFRKNGAKMAELKMAAYSFSEKGIIHLPVEDEGRDAIDQDRAEELAIEAGAEEVTKEVNDDDIPIWKIISDPKDLHSVKKHLQTENLQVLYSSHEYVATIFQKVNQPLQEQLANLFDKLEAHEDVVKIYDNVQVD